MADDSNNIVTSPGALHRRRCICGNLPSVVIVSIIVRISTENVIDKQRS
jgi:hypothetical protein